MEGGFQHPERLTKKKTAENPPSQEGFPPSRRHVALRDEQAYEHAVTVEALRASVHSNFYYCDK